MSTGDTLLRADGTERLSPDGTSVLDDGTGDPCGCCGAICPTDCSACGNRTLVVTGLAGNCVCANGTYTLTKSGCVWSYFGRTTDSAFSFFHADFRCTGGVWTLTMTCLSTCAAASPVFSGDYAGAASLTHRAGTDDCGRLDTYVAPDAGASIHCTGQTATGVVS